MQKFIFAAVLFSSVAANAVVEEADPEIHPAVISLASAEGGAETDAKSQRVRTLAAAKQLMKLMNVAAMAEERAKELIEEARKADAEADLVRAPIQDHSDKKARYHRAKTLQNAAVLNTEVVPSPHLRPVQPLHAPSRPAVHRIHTYAHHSLQLSDWPSACSWNHYSCPSHLNLY